MVSELKGNNGKTVGSEDYFKKINEKVLVGERMKDKKKWDYYKVLGGSSAAVNAVLKGANGKSMKASLELIAKEIKSDLSSARQGKDYVLSKNQKNIEEAFNQLTKCGVTNLSSLKTTMKKLGVIEDFHGNAIVLPYRDPEKNSISANLKYDTTVPELHIVVNVTFLGWGGKNEKRTSMDRHELEYKTKVVIAGFKKWEGDYKVFGGYPIKVFVEVNEVDTGDGALTVHLVNNLDEALTWGGDRLLGWKCKNGIIADKFMVIGRHDVDVYKHEFGHALGLGDAYEGHYIKGLYDMDGVDTSLYPDLDSYPKNSDGSPDMVMNNDEPVRDNDIEMVLLAFSTGKRQNYQKESDDNLKWISGTGEISEALGRGN